MYGKGQNSNALFSQLEKALEKNESKFNMSKGDQQRDYLPIEKAAEYIVGIAKQKRINGIINCCSGVPITINNLVEKFLMEKSKTIKLNKGYYPYPEYEPLNFWGDDAKLKKIIG
jgi:dTDP-6-deoxy-L-talose 4-dehydrogenase (NAD+)